MSVLSPDNPSTSLAIPRIPSYLETIRNASVSNETIDWFDKTSYLLEKNLPDENATSSVVFFGSQAHKTIRGFCKQILFNRITTLGIRYWDLAIWIPNILFFIFLIIRFARVRRKIQQTQSPVFKAFFILIYLIVALNLLRCFASISIITSNQANELVDKILWLILKFFTLSAELCILTFGLIADSQRSIRNALIGILTLSSLHLALQTVLEFHLKTQPYEIDDPAEFNLYAHGGMGLWMISSGLFAIVYSIACLLPNTCTRRVVTLSARCSFYTYCLILAILNVAHMIGAAIMFTDSLDGLCLVDLTTFLYFTLYAPLVYFVFLHRPLSSDTARGGGLLFSYRKQKDETTGDIPNVSIYYPHFSGLTSPSYDDLFDCDSLRRPRYGFDTGIETDFYHHQTDLTQLNDPFNYEVPLMVSQRTPESTVTTHVDYDYSPENSSKLNGYDDRVLSMKPSLYDVGSANSFGPGPKQLKGLGPNGTLIFSTEDKPLTKRI